MEFVQTTLDGELVKIINVTGNEKNTSIAYIDSNNNLKVKIKAVTWDDFSSTQNKSVGVSASNITTDYGTFTSLSAIENITSANYPNLKIGDIAYLQLTYERKKYIYTKSVYTNETFWAWDVVVNGGLLYSCFFYDYPNTYDGTITWKAANNGLISLPNSVSATSRSQFGRDPIFPKELFKLGRQIRWKFIGGYPMYDAATTLGVRLYYVSGATQTKLDQCQFTRAELLSSNPAFPTGNQQRGGNFGGFGAIQPATSGVNWSGRFHGEFDLDNSLSYLSFRELGDVASTGNLIPNKDVQIGLSLWVNSGASPNAGIHDQFWVEVV